MDDIVQFSQLSQESQEILDAIPVPIFYKDASSHYIGCNKACLEALGLSREQFIGKTTYEVSTKELADLYFSKDIELLHTPGIQTYEGKIRYYDGLLHDVLFHRITLSDKDGKVTGIMGIVFDITKKKQDEAELKATHDMLCKTTLDLQKALQDLKNAQQQVIQQERLHVLTNIASSIAHDFNNSLTPIIGFVDLLLNVPGYLSERNRAIEYLKRVKLAAQDALHIVRRLRAFYRRSTDDENMTDIEINAVVQESIFLTEPKWKTQALAKGISINIITQLQKMPTFLGHSNEIREIVTGLIFNAVDAMPDGGTLKIRTSVSGEWIVLDVSDSGTGMTQDIRVHCLEPFFTTKGELGSGLGLSIVSTLVQKYHGKIEICSIPKQGSQFLIYIPITSQTNHKDVPENKQKLPCQHILLISDNEPMCKVLQEYLLVDEHTWITVQDIDLAIEKINQKEKFDLIICEHVMAHIHGEQTCKILKEKYPYLPIIMVTGFDNVAGIFSPVSSCANLILHRPLSLEQIRQALVAISERKR